MKLSTLTVMLAAAAIGFGQAAPGTPPKNDPKAPSAKEKAEQDRIARELARLQNQRDQDLHRGETQGVQVRIKEISRFRGVRPNQLMGVGLVVGLAGTGDSKKTTLTSSIVSNLFKDFGIQIEATEVDMRNIAAVMITAELPPFATNGLPIDVSVQSLGDAKSLAGGTLLQAPLYAAGDRETIYLMAQGPLTLGGYDVSGGGSSAKKNFVTAGRIPGGGLVQKGAPTKVLYPDRKMYLDLDVADTTTADRVAKAIVKAFPELMANATNPGTVELTLPAEAGDVQTMSRIEQLQVFVDTLGTIVVNERTGTIVMGGNVRLGPAVIAHGSLSVRIDEQILISQPEPFSNGSTVVVPQYNVDANEHTTQIATIAPTTTVADLAKIFQALDLKAADIISILQALRQQGALKARIVVQ